LTQVIAGEREIRPGRDGRRVAGLRFGKVPEDHQHVGIAELRRDVLRVVGERKARSLVFERSEQRGETIRGLVLDLYLGTHAVEHDVHRPPDLLLTEDRRALPFFQWTLMISKCGRHPRAAVAHDCVPFVLWLLLLETRKPPSGGLSSA
jgi:hypothetical protein